MAVQRRQPGGANAAHLVELVQRPEAAVLGAVVEDPLSQRRPDAVQRLQLLERGRVEVHRRLRAARCSRRHADDRLAAAGHHHLLAVGQPGGEVQTGQVGAAGGPRLAHGVQHPRTGRQPVDARAPHRPHHVHDHNRRLGLGRHRRRAHGRRIARGGAAGLAAPADHQHHHRHDRVEGQPLRGDREHATMIAAAPSAVGHDR
jgi:hypothetical protein